MRRISESRLRKVEASAPKPHKTLVFLQSIVEPNPDGGEPIECGVLSRTKTIPGGSLVEVFAEPWPDADALPEEMMVFGRNRGRISEWFFPPIPETQLPDAVDPVAVARYYQNGKFARKRGE